jgi:hypothetical protein
VFSRNYGIDRTIKLNWNSPSPGKSEKNINRLFALQIRRGEIKKGKRIFGFLSPPPPDHNASFFKKTASQFVKRSIYCNNDTGTLNPSTNAGELLFPGYLKYSRSVFWMIAQVQSSVATL